MSADWTEKQHNLLQSFSPINKKMNAFLVCLAYHISIIFPILVAFILPMWSPKCPLFQKHYILLSLYLDETVPLIKREVLSQVSLEEHFFIKAFNKYLDHLLSVFYQLCCFGLFYLDRCSTTQCSDWFRFHLHNFFLVYFWQSCFCFTLGWFKFAFLNYKT